MPNPCALVHKLHICGQIGAAINTDSSASKSLFGIGEFGATFKCGLPLLFVQSTNGLLLGCGGERCGGGYAPQQIVKHRRSASVHQAAAIRRFQHAAIATHPAPAPRHKY
ncbi:MAG: hypothetical protein DWG76_08120 [Chloroflexi bacterium]|nr:hypothetical protein [Chloroflexota bacterium]